MNYSLLINDFKKRQMGGDKKSNTETKPGICSLGSPCWDNYIYIGPEVGVKGSCISEKNLCKKKTSKAKGYECKEKLLKEGKITCDSKNPKINNKTEDDSNKNLDINKYKKCLDDAQKRFDNNKIKLCPRGYCSAKHKFEVYPSAYANGYATSVCKGTKPDALKKTMEDNKYMKKLEQRKKTKKNNPLKRWYKEEWVNICESGDGPGGYAVCGSGDGIENLDEYPYCRAYYKLDNTSVVTVEELEKYLTEEEFKNLKQEMCDKKRSFEQGVDGKPTRINLPDWIYEKIKNKRKVIKQKGGVNNFLKEKKGTDIVISNKSKSKFKRKFIVKDELNIQKVVEIESKIIKYNIYPNLNEIIPIFYALYNGIKSMQLDICVNNPDEIKFNYQNLMNILYKQYGKNELLDVNNDISQPKIYKNDLYIYPNLDNHYNSFLNNPLNSNYDNILDNPFSIKLQTEGNTMITLVSYNMLVIDFDTKDFFDEVNNTTNYQMKEYIKKSFNKLCVESKKRYNLNLVFCVTETDKGLHLYLVNHYIDSRDPFWTNLLIQMCSDIWYAAFSRARGFCIRLTKKPKRESDMVARPMKEILGEILATKYPEFIYADNEDLLTIKIDLIKILKFKFRLINYFQNFTEKHLDYCRYFMNQKYIDKIRTHLALIWKTIPDIEIIEKELQGISLNHNIFSSDVQLDTSEMFEEINNIFLKQIRFKKSNNLIEEIDEQLIKEGGGSNLIKIPLYVKQEAKKGIKLHEAGYMGGTQTGWDRGYQLANDARISINDLADMRTWFARHGPDAQNGGTSYPGYCKWLNDKLSKHILNKNSYRGAVSWLIWGGDAAYRWLKTPEIRNLIEKKFPKRKKSPKNNNLGC